MSSYDDFTLKILVQNKLEAKLRLTSPNFEGFVLSYTKTKYMSDCHQMLGEQIFLKA